MVTLDVEKAFLQGLSFKEIEATTGEPEREILFSLPPGSAALLRKIPGFETFDERYECLRALKPGTGTKGAPRAFSLKLQRITQGAQCRMRSTTNDRELETRHDSGVLTAMAAKHVDDIKLGGQPRVIKEIIQALESEFGKLTHALESFTNTGVRQKRLSYGSVTMDQDEYIAALRPIVFPDMIVAPGEREATPELSELFRSLLGAAAYFLLG